MATKFDLDYARVVLARAENLAEKERAERRAYGERYFDSPEGRSRASLAATLRNRRAATEKAFEQLLQALYGGGRYEPIERALVSRNVLNEIQGIWMANGPTLMDGALGTGTIAMRNLVDREIDLSHPVMKTIPETVR